MGLAVIADDVLREMDSTVPIGGKAQGLVRLMRAGVSVPRFFVLPPNADIEMAVAAWEKSGWASCAVRSSAMGEDGIQHSFAGMYETQLGVQTAEGLREAIASCRRSASSPRIDAYRTMHGLSISPVAVIVQELVVGQASGVAFSSDPMNPDVTLISASWGLGEGVVSGVAPADTYRVDEQGNVAVQIVHKDRMVTLDAAQGVPMEVAVAPDKADLAALSDTVAARLAGMARRLEAALGGPQDIEWTCRDGTLVLLQTRPITQPIPKGRRLLWDNSNIIESYCGLTLPLTYSFASHAYTIVYQLFCEVMGVKQDVIRRHAGIFPRMIGLVRGRIYYNLNAWYTVVSLLPGYRWNRHFLEQMMGVSEVADEAEVQPVSRWQRLLAGPQMVRLIGGLLWRAGRLNADVRSFTRTFEQAVGHLQGQVLDDRSAFELLSLYEALERRLLWAWSTPIVNDFFVMIFHGLLRSLSERWLSDAPDIHNALLSHEGGMISTAPAVEAVKLAQQVRGSVTLSALFDADSDAEAVLAKLPQYDSFYAAFQAYIDRFGDRVADELKLEVETYRHRPALLVHTLRSYLSGDWNRLSQMGTHERQGRQQADRLVAQTLHGWRAWVFGWVLSRARQRVIDRENLRFLRTRIYAIVREIFRALGGHLVAAGALSHRRDVFWLTVDEVFGWVRGTTVTTNLQALVDLRRAEYAGFANDMTPADRFRTWGPVWAHNGFVGAPVISGDTTAIRGLPAFPGRVEGVVRCITDPRTQALQDGEILVAHRTDPGWTPLFPKAAAILVERGSLLSHSAVVAREFGIPTIVSIPDLRQRLRTGDRVCVDATTGVVTVLTPTGISAVQDGEE